MKRMVKSAQDEAIEAIAAAWLAQRDGGLTPEEEKEFNRWRSADVRHESAVARLEAAWGALQQLRDFRPEARMHPDRDLLRPRARRRLGPFAKAAVLAAAACLVVGATIWCLRPNAMPAPAAEDYATTVDGYQRVVLSDGSILELNANSAVSVQFIPGERRVRLARGEAHFTVAKDKARPFFVHAGTIAVRAVGTAFDVRLGARDVEVLVTEGTVEVAKASPPATGARPVGDGRPASDSNSPPTRLSANERTLVPMTPVAAAPLPVVEKVSSAAIRETLAWQGPRLVFVDTPLAEVVAQFNRRNQVQLVLRDPELASIPVGGSFRAENLDAFVRLMTTDNDISSSQPDPGHIVLRKGK